MVGMADGYLTTNFKLKAMKPCHMRLLCGMFGLFLINYMCRKLATLLEGAGYLFRSKLIKKLLKSNMVLNTL